MQLIIASDGVAGGGQQGNIPRPDSTVPGEELGRQRVEEARCATQALGIPPPILLDFPDGKLGDYVGDRALIYRVTQRIAEELARLRPDAVITWGPDGGTGHPDHRLVSNIVTQLQRAGPPGVPEHVFYMNLPVESMRAMNPQRGEPPLTLPQARYFTVRVPFTPEDLQASARGMACHKTQFTSEVVQRVHGAAARAWNGAIPLIPAFSTPPLTDLFRQHSATFAEDRLGLPRFHPRVPPTRGRHNRVLDFGDRMTVQSNAQSPQADFFQRVFETMRRKGSARSAR